MVFSFRAMSSSGSIVHDTIDVASQREAADRLRADGLTILSIAATASKTTAHRRTATRRKGCGRDLVLFSRQMQMLLHSGSALVPALIAIEQQISRSGFAGTVRAVRDHVESGGSLSEALREHPRVFGPVFCTIIAAGEASGTLPDAFARLAHLVDRQQRVRKAVIGALLYPALLAVMCLGVVNVMLFFVMPRFSSLFEMLKRPLPATTQIMFFISDGLREYWPWGLGALLLPIIALVVLLKNDALRARLDPLLTRLPIIGHLVSRLLLARVLRIWAAMLRCHVPLLETIEQSQNTVGNRAFRRMVSDVHDEIAAGGRIGAVLARSNMVDPVITSAIDTGEQNGKLAEAVDFVSNWLDSDNEQLINTATRVAEPLLLALMGVFVGAVAMSLFLPLFDMATAR